jgi:hypothetical protein
MLFIYSHNQVQLANREQNNFKNKKLASKHNGIEEQKKVLYRRFPAIYIFQQFNTSHLIFIQL